MGTRWVAAAGAALLLMPAAAAAQAPAPFLDREGPDLWRASQVAGVPVLGPDGKQVGTVVDLLLDHDGRAADVVVGVGGLLGVGQKDVALPYGQVHFADAPPPGGGPAERAAAQEKGGFLSANGGLAGSGAIDGAGAPQGQAPGTPREGKNPAALGGPVGTTAEAPGGRVTGPAAMPAAPPGGTAAPDRTTAHPDHATVDLTAAQLKAAPAFTFAR